MAQPDPQHAGRLSEHTEACVEHMLHSDRPYHLACVCHVENGLASPHAPFDVVGAQAKKIRELERLLERAYALLPHARDSRPRALAWAVILASVAYMIGVLGLLFWALVMDHGLIASDLDGPAWMAGTALVCVYAIRRRWV